MEPVKDINGYAWALSDQVGPDIKALLGQIPSRWGRMTPLCRVLIVEVGRLLCKRGILETGQRCNDRGLQVGLIGGTRNGSLHTDLSFIRTMEDGPGLASPALFGYTLPNIPLAEAASHYGLVGPVYALFEVTNPFEAAVREARQLLLHQNDLSMMIACEFDHYACRDQDEKLLATLTLVDKDADSYSDLSQVE
ncbi:MAG: hypothetical protein WBB23_11080 [Desulforhopalus sp.]